MKVLRSIVTAAILSLGSLALIPMLCDAFSAHGIQKQSIARLSSLSIFVVKSKTTQNRHNHAVNAGSRTAKAGRGVGPLHAIIDVPDGFFTTAGLFTGLFLSISKTISRSRIEERAWEIRLEEARKRKLEQEPTLTELDVRREEAAKSYSAYGPQAQLEREKVRVRQKRRGRWRDDQEEEYEDDGAYGDDEEDEYGESRARSMTDEEIDAFEKECGVDYDPYYDEPYDIDELPQDVPYREDKRYGDRMYENGETFYKDAETGMYWRQGSRPRIKKFWSF